MTMIAEADLPFRSAPLAHQTVAMAAAPPLIEGESSAGYDQLLARICETLRPSDVLEQGWSARALRYALLAAHYRAPLEFGDETMPAAAAA